MSATDAPLCPACGLEPPDPDDHAQRHGFESLEAIEAALEPQTRDAKLRAAVDSHLADLGYAIVTAARSSGLTIARAPRDPKDPRGPDRHRSPYL